MKGWVYVITNQAMPGLVKVGYSMKDPAVRASELNSTGVPHPYEIEYHVLLEDPKAVEQKTHRALIARREGKEWFRCPPEEAVLAIQKVAGNNIIHEDYGRVDRAKAEEAKKKELQRREKELAKRKQQEALNARKAEIERDIQERIAAEQSKVRNTYEQKLQQPASQNDLPFSPGQFGCFAACCIGILALVALKYEAEGLAGVLGIGGIIVFFLSDVKLETESEQKEKQLASHRAMKEEMERDLKSVELRIRNPDAPARITGRKPDWRQPKVPSNDD